MSDGGAWDNEGIEQPKRLQRISRGMPLDKYLLMSHPGNWPVLVVPLMCLAVFIGQLGGYVPMDRYAFSAAAVNEGRFYTSITSMFMHGSAYHILGNMLAYLACAPLVIARFGSSWRNLFPFHVFYLICGVAGDALFYALHPASHASAIGASGAIFGVLAAFWRIDMYKDRLWPIFSKRSLRALVYLIISNVTLLLVIGGPLVISQIEDGGTADLSIPIAWEAHVGGFVAGFFLIGLMAGRRWPPGWRAGKDVPVEDREDI